MKRDRRGRFLPAALAARIGSEPPPAEIGRPDSVSRTRRGRTAVAREEKTAPEPKRWASPAAEAAAAAAVPGERPRDLRLQRAAAPPLRKPPLPALSDGGPWSPRAGEGPARPPPAPAWALPGRRAPEGRFPHPASFTGSEPRRRWRERGGPRARRAGGAVGGAGEASPERCPEGSPPLGSGRAVPGRPRCGGRAGGRSGSSCERSGDLGTFTWPGCLQGP